MLFSRNSLATERLEPIDPIDSDKTPVECVGRFVVYREGAFLEYKHDK